MTTRRSGDASRKRTAGTMEGVPPPFPPESPVRFVFRPPATEAAGLLGLPWDRPLAAWPEDVLADVPQRRISRHVVRYVALEGTVYALKEIVEPLARKEYALLADFAADGLPTVAVVGICVDRPGDQPAILITRYLDYSVSYRHLS